MNKSFPFLAMTALLMLNACAQAPKTSPSRVTDRTIPVQITGNESLLEFAGRFVDLSAEAQKKELAQINQNISQNKSDLNYRMKATMIYALPGSRLRDVGKAQALLDDLLHEKNLDTEHKALASILKDTIVENNKLSQKVHDEQKRADILQQKFDATQQRADALQQKLDDLKTIEKTMVDREQGVRK